MSKDNSMMADIMESEYGTSVISKEEEAKCNAKMKALLTKSLELKEAAERGDDDNYVEETKYIMHEADKILRKAKCSSTAYLDALLLHTNSLIYKNLVEKMDCALSEFKAKDFAENILQYFGNKTGNHSIWPAIGDERANIFNNAGGWTWQLGAIDRDECQKLQRKRNNREILIDVPKKNPEKVHTLEKEEEDLEQHMQTIMSIICKWENAKKESLQFWDLVLHPTSFSETIENTFHVSHLVRERLIYLSMDRHGLPVVKALKSDTKVDSDNNPVAVNINMKQWKDFVDAYGIKQSMIPTRNSC